MRDSERQRVTANASEAVNLAAGSRLKLHPGLRSKHRGLKPWTSGPNDTAADRNEAGEKMMKSAGAVPVWPRGISFFFRGIRPN